MRPAVLFDLGNTLAEYYHADQFQPILEKAIGELVSELRSQGLTRVSFDAALATATAENREAPDYRFTPMAQRFERIFEMSFVDDPPLARKLCAVFLRPIFEVGRVYHDASPTLNRLRHAGHPVAIVSNAPWGSPPDLWREELKRLGLADAVDSIVLCGDVGWRKPARQIFEFAAAAVDRKAEECIFVGDDLCWDIAGSEAIGMRPVLIDRDRRHAEYPGERIEDLNGLSAMVAAGA